MQQTYGISLEHRYPIELGLLKNEFRRGYIHSLGLFVPESIEKLDHFLFAKTIEGNEIGFTPKHFTYFCVGPLEEQNFLNGIKSAIGLAKKLERDCLSFNPNLLRLGGHFDGDEVSFEREFGPISRNIQKVLYGGGIVGYTRSSDDYHLYFGTEEEIGKKLQVRFRVVKKLEFEGTTKPANSLDELLVRLEQK